MALTRSVYVHSETGRLETMHAVTHHENTLTHHIVGIVDPQSLLLHPFPHLPHGVSVKNKKWGMYSQQLTLGGMTDVDVPNVPASAAVT